MKFFVDLIGLILIVLGLYMIHPGLAVIAAGFFFSLVAAEL